MAEEKEIIETSTIQAMGRNQYGNLEEEDLKEALKNQDVTVEKSGRNFKLTFKKSNRKYILNSNGESESIEEINPTAIYAKLETDGTLKLRSTPLQGYEEGTKWNSPDILKVLIEEPIAPKTCARMFSECINLEGIENMNYLHTENATSMERMFQKCEKLKNINTSYLDTHNVKRMDYMFDNCLLLEKIDVSNFNTSQVTFMRNMFSNCKNLKQLDLTGFDVSKVTSMISMFQNSGLESIDFSNFNAESLKDVTWMFSTCKNLKKLDFTNFKTGKLGGLREMFTGCENLKTLNLNGFDTSEATSMYRTFEGCKSLEYINISSFKTEKVTTMYSMFNGCSSLKNIDLSNFNTAKVTTMWSMFNSCSSLETLDLQSFNTESIQGNGRERMFRFDSNLSKILVSKDWSLDYNGATQIFEGCGVKEVKVVE